MVKFNLSLSEVSELKIGKRTFKRVRDLSEATERDFLLYVGVPCPFFDTGSVYSIRELSSNGDILIVDDDGDLYTVEEGEEGFVLLRPEYTERDEEFIRLGREPEQFKVGDIVQVLETLEIGVITEFSEDTELCKVKTSSKHAWAWTINLRLIAPVEHTNKIE